MLYFLFIYFFNLLFCYFCYFCYFEKYESESGSESESESESGFRSMPEANPAKRNRRTPTRKMIEIERLKLMSKLAKAETELNELKSAKREHDSRYSEDPQDEKDLLDDYLQTQLNSVISTNSDDESFL